MEKVNFFNVYHSSTSVRVLLSFQNCHVEVFQKLPMLSLKAERRNLMSLVKQLATSVIQGSRLLALLKYSAEREIGQHHPCVKVLVLLLSNPRSFWAFHVVNSNNFYLAMQVSQAKRANRWLWMGCYHTYFSGFWETRSRVDQQSSHLSVSWSW